MPTILLFLHLCGVALLFIMISMELGGPVLPPPANTAAQLRAATFATPAIETIAPIATIVIVVSGLWMVAISDFLDFGAAWVIVAIIATVTLAVAGPTVQGKRLEALRAAAFAAPDGPASTALRGLADDRVMHLAGWASSGAGIGFLYLMADRPDAFASIATFVVSPLLGVAVGGVLLSRAATSRSQSDEPPTMEPVTE